VMISTGPGRADRQYQVDAVGGACLKLGQLFDVGPPSPMPCLGRR
jgi:hypothetical protein